MAKRNNELWDAIMKNEIDKVEELLSVPGNLDRKITVNGWRPLHVAVFAGRASIIAELLKKGADVNATDEDRNTPLHTAALVGDVELMGKLIDAGADIDAPSVLGRPLELAIDERNANIEDKEALMKRAKHRDEKLKAD